MNLDKKLELAHEYAVANNSYSSDAWAYADAMEVEYEKRIKAKAEKDAKVFFDCIDKCKHDCGTDLTQGLGGFYIKSCNRCGYFVETGEDGKDSLRIRPNEKPVPPEVETPPIKIIGGG